MNQNYPITIYQEPDLPRSSLVLGWSEDAGDLGRKVTDYLNLKLNGQEFAEVDPEDFFPMGGVAIKDNIARFPESKFYACPEHELAILRTDSPLAEWYKFLNSVLDVAERHCRVRELYVLGAMISFSAHTAPRQLIAVVNSTEMKEVLTQDDLNRDMDYQTQPGERPTLNSFLLWLARERNIPGVSVWVLIPFYLAAMEDPQAQRKVLSFLSERLGLRIDFSDLDQEIGEQNEQLAVARSRFPQIDDYINRLESNLVLSREENGELVKKIEEFLGEGD
ncbi:MAG: PAC2 family protein [Dehalococcoidia bacterium]|nr:PAC2 family protein [Dehalococcoidia bacterium]MDH4366949.1 PAC2 family protein [Dehalococcoidia bacterium]